MPLHEFRCAACHAEFESLVRRGETPACPSCDHGDVERLWSGFAVGGGRATGPGPAPFPAPAGGG